MNKFESKYSSKQFLSLFVISSVILLFGIGLTTYLVDPFFQFRVKKDSRYLLNPWFVNGGLAKHYDYNTIVLGSSMVQNYNLSIIEKKDSLARPLRLSTGGMNIAEMEYLYALVDKNKVESFIINLDIPQFNLTEEDVRYPKYLYEDGLLNRLEYLFGYESCFRFAPVDIGLGLYLKDKKDVSPKFGMKTTIENIGNNALDGHYNAEYVKRLYLSGINVSRQSIEGMNSRMQNRLDSLFYRLELNKYQNIQYTFVLPPYSALYWFNAQKSGYYDNFFEFVYYLNKKIEEYPNVKLAFFFDVNDIIDLNLYTDITHFSPVLSDKVLKNIGNSDYLLNSSNIDCKLQRLDSLVNVFAGDNKDWLFKK